MNKSRITGGIKAFFLFGGILLPCLLVLGIFVFIEIISFNHNLAVDLTPEKQYTLSNQAKNVLNSLDDDVYIKTFYSPDDREKYEIFFNKMSSYSSRIKYQLIDLDRNPGKARIYRATNPGHTIIEYKGKSNVINPPTEETVVNALLRLSGTHQKSFYIVKGYGKINEFAKLKETLKHENWYIEEIYLDDLAEISRKGNAVLMIDGPENDLSEKEIGGLEQYLNSGGKVIILLEPFTKINNLKAFLEKWGIELPEEIIIDQKNKLYGGDYLAPLIPYYAKVPVTDQMSMSSLFSTVRPVDMKKGGSSNGASVMALASSSENSWTKKSREDVLKGRIDYLDGIDRPGTVPVAALSTMLIPDKRGISKSSEIICFGDGDFIKDSFIEIMGNQDLFLNAVEWLARDYTLISIREKQFIYPYQFLSSRQGSILFQVSVILLPLIFLITCVAIFFYRRIRG